MGWTNKVREEDVSPEVRFLLKQIKFEELLPKTRDAVNLFFLNVKKNPDAGGEVSEVALLRPVYRAIAKKEDITEKGGLRSIVTLLSSQTLPLQLQASKALGSLATDADDDIMEALRGLNVHITSMKMLSGPSVSEQLLVRLLYILYHIAKNGPSQMALIRIRLVYNIVNLLETSPEKPLPVQRLCYMIFASLAVNKDTHDIMAKEDAITQCVKAILQSDDQVRYQALKVLSAYSKQEKGRVALVKHKAIASLHKAISSTPPLDATSTGIALSTLGHLSEDADGQQEIAASGVVETVTIIVHGSNATLAEKALKAILNFSVFAPCRELLVTTPSFVSVLYYRAMKGDNVSKTLAVSILNNLSSSDRFLEQLGLHNLVELVNGMPPAPVIVQRVIARIVKATARYDEVKNALVENACISIFTGIMNNTKDDFVLAEIIDAFAILTKHERIRKVIIACGHTMKIVGLLASNLFTRLQLPIITVIANFTLEEQGVAAVLRLNGAFTLFCRFALIHENLQVQTHALMAVSNLLVNDQLREEVINIGVLEAAMYLMFSKDLNLQTGAVRVVAKVAQSQRFHQYLQQEDILEHLKELKLHENFKVSGNSKLVSAFKELIFALKSAGNLPPIDNSERTIFWIKAQLNEFSRLVKVPVDISLEELAKLMRATYGFKEDHKITMMFRDAGYPVVVHASDELLLFWMNYQSGKKVILNVFDGDVPDATIEEINFKPAPPPPPPPPPGLLNSRKGALNPFATPAYIKDHKPGETRMAVKPQNALLPENLMTDILSAVKNRSEGKHPLNPAAARPLNAPPAPPGPDAPTGAYLGPLVLRPAGTETTGGREFFRDAGKWYRGVQQVFLVHPIMIKVVFDMVDSRSDHKSFTKCFETAVSNLPHMLPHMQSQVLDQSEFADSLLKIGFNVKSTKVTAAGGKEETKYELIVRPSSLPPELLLKAILLSTAAAGI